MNVKFLYYRFDHFSRIPDYFLQQGQYFISYLNSTIHKSIITFVSLNTGMVQIKRHHNEQVNAH